MKITFSSTPEAFTPYDNGRTLVCYQYEQVERTFPSPEGEQKIAEYEGDCVIVEAPVTYGKVVEAIIREKYAVSDELAALRQKEDKPEKFEAYNTCCAEAKAAARKLFPND